MTDTPQDQQQLHFDELEQESPPTDAAIPASGCPAESPIKALFDSHFLQYASYVIRDRAIPHLVDGLKPVQRRILHSLHEKDDGRFIKVANIVGHAMQYHPHGDASIADALVTLTNRRYLIEGQGNFGNVFTGDPAAASRYIECRLTPLAREHVFNDDLTIFIPSYDGRNKEPVTLPARLPLLLMLGAEGIAVGLSTRILPHNFGELIEAQIAILRQKPFVILPDFPQGGLMDASEYAAGNGRIRLRALIEPRGDAALVIREIPYGTTTDQLIASIEDAAQRHKVPVKNITDFTADAVEIELTLESDTEIERARQALYAFTDCEISLSVRAIVINEQKPVEMTVDEILRANTAILTDLLKRDLELQRFRLVESLHFKTLVGLFIEQGIYRRIEQCTTAAAIDSTVREGLQPFRDQLQRDITAKDVDQLLDIRIKRISRYDLEKNREELVAIRADIVAIDRHLADIVHYTVAYLRRLRRAEAAAYPRRTNITTFERMDLKEITASELTLRYDRENGYLGSEIGGEELLQCSSYERLLLVWKRGRYRVVAPPEKLFVDKDLLYCRPYDRDRLFTAVYTDSGITYLKRFVIGGAITNRDYVCIPDGARLILLAEGDLSEIYVRYAPSDKLKIRQQVFKPEQMPVQSPKNAGSQMTVKPIEWIGIAKDEAWDDTLVTPAGKLLRPGG